MNETIQAKVLIGIIGADKYRKLKARGKLAVARCAGRGFPEEVEVASIPTCYRHLLASALLRTCNN